MKKLLIAALLTVSVATAAVAQENRVHIRGKIVSLAGNVLTVGAAIVRVHDVAPTVDALKVWRALQPA